MDLTQDPEIREIYEASGVKPFAPLPEPGNVDAPKEPAAVTPPKDSAPKARTKPSTAAANRTTSLEKRLTEMYVSIGTLICTVDLTCGQAVIMSAPDTASALDTLAKDNKAVRKALEKMLAGGAWGGVLMAHFPIITTVLAHHGILPPNVASVMGVTPKAKKPTLRTVPTEDGSSVGDRRED